MKINVTVGKKTGERVGMFTARSWNSAWEAINHAREMPPMGYKLVNASVRDENSGSRVELKLVLSHNNRTMPALTMAESFKAFHVYYDTAQGR